MSKHSVTIECDRCHKMIDGMDIPGSGTAGFYKVTGLPWSKYANPGEKNVCDDCMWRDKRYIVEYGDRLGLTGDA